MSDTITCNKCGQEKPADTRHFLKDAHSRIGFRKPCKECKGITTIRGYGGPKPTGKGYEAQLERTRERRRDLRNEMLAAYGNRCACCGETEPKFLTLDHTNEDGNQHRAEVGRAASFIHFIRRQGYPKGNLQLLCANCHIAKSYYGGCPHKANMKPEEITLTIFDGKETHRVALNPSDKIEYWPEGNGPFKVLFQNLELPCLNCGEPTSRYETDETGAAHPYCGCEPDAV